MNGLPTIQLLRNALNAEPANGTLRTMSYPHLSHLKKCVEQAVGEIGQELLYRNHKIDLRTPLDADVESVS